MRGIDAASSYWPGATPTKSLPASLAELKQRRVDIFPPSNGRRDSPTCCSGAAVARTPTGLAQDCVNLRPRTFSVSARCEKLACKPGLDLQLSFATSSSSARRKTGFFGFGNPEQVPTLKMKGARTRTRGEPESGQMF